MADILLSIDQTDNGQNVVITDATEWSNTAATGVTAVLITISYPTSTTYTVKNVSMSQPCPQSALTWTIPSTDVGFGDGVPFMDNIYTFTVTYTTSPATDPLTAQIYFDWNAKYYDLLLVKNLPYYIDNQDFAFIKEIEDSMLFNTLLRGAQYNAAVGQTTKLTDIMNIIAKYVKVTKEHKGFYRHPHNTSSIQNSPLFPGYTP